MSTTIPTQPTTGHRTSKFGTRPFILSDFGVPSVACSEKSPRRPSGSQAILFGSERKWLSAVHEFGKRVRLADLRGFFCSIYGCASRLIADDRSLLLPPHRHRRRRAHGRHHDRAWRRHARRPSCRSARRHGEGDACRDVRATGADIMLGNTYHLMLRPGAERVARAWRPARIHGWPGRSSPIPAASR